MSEHPPMPFDPERGTPEEPVIIEPGKIKRGGAELPKKPEKSEIKEPEKPLPPAPPAEAPPAPPPPPGTGKKDDFWKEKLYPDKYFKEGKSDVKEPVPKAPKIETEPGSETPDSEISGPGAQKDK